MPSDVTSFSFKAERAAAVCFVGDERVRRYANAYLARPEFLSSPLVAVTYVFPEFGLRDLFSGGALHPEIAQCLHNESLGGAYGPFEHSDDARLHRSFVSGRAGEWRHGVNLAVDPVLVFAFGAVDVEELANDIAAGDLEEEIERRIDSFEKAVANVLSQGFERLSLLAIGSGSHVSDRAMAIARRLDRHLERLAKAAGVGLIEDGDPSEVMDVIVKSRLSRRASHASEA
jgi:hypothetical protein